MVNEEVLSCDTNVCTTPIKANTDASIKAAEERIKSELQTELASKHDIERLE